MRVNDQIRLNATLREGHVNGGPKLRANTLLTVSRGELVTNNRLTRDTVLDADRLSGLVAALGAHDANALDETCLGILVLEEVRDTVHVHVGI